MISRALFLERFSKSLNIQPSLHVNPEIREQILDLCTGLINPEKQALSFHDQFAVYVDFMATSKEFFQHNTAIDHLQLEAQQPIHPPDSRPEVQQVLSFLIDSEDALLSAKKFKQSASNKVKYFDSIIAFNEAMEHSVIAMADNNPPAFRKFLEEIPETLCRKYLNLVFSPNW